MLPPQEQLMTTGCCRCSRRSTPVPLRRTEILAGGMSVLIWMLLPKCPVCLAAYVALWTGLGLTVTQAVAVRWILMAVTSALICYTTVKLIVKSASRAAT